MGTNIKNLVITVPLTQRTGIKSKQLKALYVLMWRDINNRGYALNL